MKSVPNRIGSTVNFSIIAQIIVPFSYEFFFHMKTHSYFLLQNLGVPFMPKTWIFMILGSF